MAPNSHLLVSINAGKVTGLSSVNNGPALSGNYTIIGRILATGSRASQNGKSDYFAGSTTAGAKYAMVQIDCVNPTAL
jgi:hypothetical protein